MPDTSWCKKGGSRGYIVTRALEWQIGKKGSGWILIVPVGKEFESSVPRWLRWLWSPDDPYYLKAALVHDHLLEGGWRRQSADAQWCEVALSVRAPKWRTRLAYLGMVLRRFIPKGSENV